MNPSMPPDSGISATEPDWSREYKPWFKWNPSRALLASIRSYQRHAKAGGLLHVLPKKLAILRYRFWSVATGADIPLNCQIGGGLLLPHPNGVVIHPDSVIGPNCLIFQQVTIGSRGDGVPTIGGHVDIGAGAKVFGTIVLGDHSLVGANAVVMQNVPDYGLAVGIPATVKRRS